MKIDQGAGNLSGAIRRRRPAVQQLRRHLRLGRLARLQGGSDRRLGRPAHRPRQGGGQQDLLRRAQGNRGQARRRDHRARHPSPGPARRRQSGLRRCTRCLRCTGRTRQPESAAGMGGRPGQARRSGKSQSRPRRPCHLLGRARLAVPLSVAAASRRTDPGGIRGAGSPLEADPRPPRRTRRRRLLRAASGRGPFRRHHLRALPRQGRRPPTVLYQLRSVALPAAEPRLCRLHRRLPRADQGVSRQGCRAAIDAAAGRLFRLLRLAGSCRPLPLARRWRRRLRRDLHPALGPQLRQLGGARMGVRGQASRAGCEGGGRVHRLPPHPGQRYHLRRFHRPGGRSHGGAAGTGTRIIAGSGHAGIISSFTTARARKPTKNIAALQCGWGFWWASTRSSSVTR